MSPNHLFNGNPKLVRFRVIENSIYSTSLVGRIFSRARFKSVRVGMRLALLPVSAESSMKCKSIIEAAQTLVVK